VIPVAGFLHYKNPRVTETTLRTFPRDLAERVVVVDNSERGTAPRHIDGIPFQARYITLMGNMGVAHGWNTIIKATPDAQWWAIFNNDLEFRRTDVERLEEAMAEYDLVIMGGFHAFGVSRRAIKKVGWFDENYHPAYCEDNDFYHRVVQAGLPYCGIPSVFRHEGSVTIRLDHDLRALNDVTYAKNVEYHQAKWGGLMHEEKYETPFNKPTGPAHGVLDIDRLRDHHWESARE
jgi:GT2 family glycosyltransferase